MTKEHEGFQDIKPEIIINNPINTWNLVQSKLTEKRIGVWIINEGINGAQIPLDETHTLQIMRVNTGKFSSAAAYFTLNSGEDVFLDDGNDVEHYVRSLEANGRIYYCEEQPTARPVQQEDRMVL